MICEEVNMAPDRLLEFHLHLAQYPNSPLKCHQEDEDEKVSPREFDFSDKGSGHVFSLL